MKRIAKVLRYDENHVVNGCTDERSEPREDTFMLNARRCEFKCCNIGVIIDNYIANEKRIFFFFALAFLSHFSFSFFVVWFCGSALFSHSRKLKNTRALEYKINERVWEKPGAKGERESGRTIWKFGAGVTRGGQGEKGDSRVWWKGFQIRCLGCPPGTAIRIMNDATCMLYVRLYYMYIHGYRHIYIFVFLLWSVIL